MKAVLFTCLDNWDKEYTYIVACEDDEVQEMIEEQKKHCTEITSYEVQKLFTHKKPKPKTDWSKVEDRLFDHEGEVFDLSAHVIIEQETDYVLHRYSFDVNGVMLDAGGDIIILGDVDGYGHAFSIADFNILEGEAELFEEVLKVIPCNDDDKD